MGGARRGAAGALNSKTDGRLATALKDAEFTGGFGKTLTLYGLATDDQSAVKRITVIGTGEGTLSARQLHDLGGYVAQASDNDKNLSVIVDGLQTSAPATSAQLAMGYALGSYRFTKYKQDAKDPNRTVAFHSNNAADAEKLFSVELEPIADGVNFARDMGTEPGKSIYPESFAQGVRGLFKGVPGVRVEVLGLSEMRKRNMGALMGVG